ncbi:uncharacterized protein LOC142339485 [Convolutriloba macropyga]|uniref:uncharacterized protein LOC142339485 n=1 Tax=Convolutriloba macropyga TaxID=536237 RepID=UPI003F51C215
MGSQKSVVNDGNMPNCAICTEILDDPRSLPCGHCFCGPQKGCLNAVKRAKNGKISCPVCRKSHNVQVEDLRPLYEIRNALQQMRHDSVANNFWYPRCAVHKNEVIVIWCQSCEQKVCPECEINHENHSLSSYKKYLQTNAESKLKLLGTSGDVLPVIEARIKSCKETLEALMKMKIEIEKLKSSEVLLNEFLTISKKQDLSTAIQSREQFDTISRILTFPEKSFWPLLDNFSPSVIKEADFEFMETFKQREKVVTTFEFENVDKWQNSEQFESKPVELNAGYSMRLCAQKRNNGEDDALYVFLKCKPVNQQITWPVVNCFQIFLKNSKSQTGETLTLNFQKFDAQSTAFGFEEVILWKSLIDSTQGWMNENTVKFKCNALVFYSQQNPDELSL